MERGTKWSLTLRKMDGTTDQVEMDDLPPSFWLNNHHYEFQSEDRETRTAVYAEIPG